MNILWNGYCYGTSGYANAGRGLLGSLSELGDRIKLLPVDKKKKKDRHFSMDLEQLKKMELFRGEKPKIAVFHRMPNGFSRRTEWNVGVTYWETSRLPNDWVEHCNRMDQLILFSEHNRKAFQESGVRVPIDVIASGVNIRTEPSGDPSITLFDQISNGEFHLSKSPNTPFTFLSVSQWIPRKGFDILLKAYFEEFRAEDDVLLIIKTNKARGTSHIQVYQEAAEIKNRAAKKAIPPLIVYSGNLPEAKLSALYQISDAYVLAARGEGVGLPYLEAGSAGLPIIATGWGGQTDFLNEENSYLLNFSLLPAQYSYCSPYYASVQLWAEPSQEHLQCMMRRVYENQAEAKQKGQFLKKMIIENHNWRAIAKAFHEKIELHVQR